MNFGHAFLLSFAIVIGADRIGAAINNMTIKLNCNITVQEAEEPAPEADESNRTEEHI